MTQLYKLPGSIVLVWLTFLLFLMTGAQAQVFQNGHYTENVSRPALDIYGGGNQGAERPLQIQLPTPPLGSHIRSAKAYVHADMGNDYPWGNLAFDVSITYQLQALTPQGTLMQTLCNGCQFKLSKDKPESVFYTDIASLLEKNPLIHRFQVSIASLHVLAPTLSASVRTNLEKSLRISLDYQIEYGLDVTNVTFQATNSLVTRGQKNVTFQWTDNGLVPSYQFQLLRLYNTDASKKTLTDITAEADWSKALTLETESSNKSLTLTIAEGTGYYLWRVRPIGSLFDGGITNPRNYGKWSSDFKGPLSVNAPDAFPTDAEGNQVAGFFYEEPDDQLNFIYSRTFTEGNRVSESITYANGLQQVRQTQARIPSQGNTVTAQTVYDFSGRPVVSTLPVPQKEQALPGYKKKFVVDGTDKVYTAENFDNEKKGNIQNPDPVKQSGTVFSYYNGETTADKSHIADAQGYAFTRTLYENDGSNRVKEQSGVGKTHMIGDGKDAHADGKTVKTFYEKATNSELIRLFGDEAPDAKSVIKTITVDQNNVASISYTSKEGKVIATCLVYIDQAGSSLLPLKEPASTVTLEDQLTGNYQSFTKIANSKRIHLLQSTTLTLDYTNACANNLSCEYTLTILIRKLNDEPFSSVSQTAADGHIAWMTDSTATQGYVLSREVTVACGSKVLFNDLTLPAGSYIIEKQLTPTAAFFNKAQEEKQKIGEKTTPLVELIAGWMDAIVCSKDVQTFYTKVDHLSAGLKGCFTGNGSTFTPPANLTNCQLTLRDTAYYRQLDTYFKKQGLVWDSIRYNAFFTPLHQVVLRRGFEIILHTPECTDLRVPLDFADVIDCDSVSRTLTERNKSYNDIEGEKRIAVNPFMFLDSGLRTAGQENLIRTEFSPDLEGYAYGFFWDCTPASEDLESEIQKLLTAYNANPVTIASGRQLPTTVSELRKAFQEKFSIYMGDDNLLNATYLYAGMTVKRTLGVANLTEAQNKIVFIYLNYLLPDMTGYEVPGTFNLMAYHMLTDQYTTDGFTADKPTDAKGNVRQLVYEGPEPKADECGNPLYLANGTIPAPPQDLSIGQPVVSQQYYCDDLYACWVSQLGFIKATRGNCPNDSLMAFDLGNPPYRLSDRSDQENGGNKGFHDGHFDNNIRLNWILKLFLGRKIKKISRKMRTMQVPVDTRTEEEKDDDTPEIPIDPTYHAVNEFLNCTGYKFAKITNTTDPTPLSTDVVTGTTYSVPSAEDSYALNPYASNTHWYPYQGQDRGYRPNPKWQRVFTLTKEGKPKKFNDALELFKFSYDPVYAFKYYEYANEVTDPNTKDNKYRRLELSTCYKDYHVDTCNICGLGYVHCELTKNNWSAGQRYSFYTILRAYNPFLDTLVLTPRANDYLSPGYVDMDENKDITFTSWDGSIEVDLVGLTREEMEWRWTRFFYPRYTHPSLTVANGYSSSELATGKNIVQRLIDRGYYQCANEDCSQLVSKQKLADTEYQNLKNEVFRIGDYRLPTKVELDIQNYNNQVMTACEAKRSELRDKLVQIFQDNCYQVVTCFEDSIQTLYADTDTTSLVNNKVLSRDIDILVDQLIRQCQERGQIGSFRLYEDSCKLASNFAKKDLITEIEYGVVKSSLHPTKTVNYHYRNTILPNSLYTPTWTTDQTIALTYKDPLTGAVKNIINMSNATYSSDIDTTVITYCEWNSRREVMEMEMKLQIPNRCKSRPVGSCDTYDAACDPTRPLNPYKAQQNLSVSGANPLPRSTGQTPTTLRLEVHINTQNQANRQLKQ